MPTTSRDPARTLAEVQRVYITETLRKTNWIVGGPAGAAASLGLPRSTLLSRMRKLGISRDTFAFGAPRPSTTGRTPDLHIPEAFAQTAAGL